MAFTDDEFIISVIAVLTVYPFCMSHVKTIGVSSIVANEDKSSGFITTYPQGSYLSQGPGTSNGESLSNATRLRIVFMEAPVCGCLSICKTLM